MKEQPQNQALGASETARFFCTKISPAASVVDEFKKHRKEPDMAKRENEGKKEKKQKKERKEKRKQYRGLLLNPISVPRARTRACEGRRNPQCHHSLPKLAPQGVRRERRRGMSEESKELFEKAKNMSLDEAYNYCLKLEYDREYSWRDGLQGGFDHQCILTTTLSILLRIPAKSRYSRITARAKKTSVFPKIQPQMLLQSSPSIFKPTAYLLVPTSSNMLVATCRRAGSVPTKVQSG